MSKQQINFRASDITSRQLDELAAWWGTSQTETITTAIDRVHREERLMRLDQLLSGETKPDTSYPTLGETFYYHNETTPLTDIGRVPGQPGQHVLRAPDGSIRIHGGYHLRRHGEIWDDFLNAVPEEDE